MVGQLKNRHLPHLGYEFLNRYGQMDENSALIHPGFEVLMLVKNSDLPDLGCEFIKRYG